ncbi:uncharacterized protein LOC131617069 [Vicia villosa]|uniref:uncharacterized protein LOC131617069 n=1 Tax=Vicia villosa TaxID=3911 RepID=UPI00273B1985|nr:uncharacterized protein LOC131617069 [Vicia villosa]
MFAGAIQDLNSIVKKNTGVEEITIGSHVQNELVARVARDLSSKFENDGAEEICEDNGSISAHNEVDPADCTTVKRGIGEVAGVIDGGDTRIRKSIKIEKD